MAKKRKAATQPSIESTGDSASEERHASVDSIAGNGAGMTVAEETRPSKRRAFDVVPSKKTVGELSVSDLLSMMEQVPIDPMVHVCEFLDLPSRWRLSRCSKALERIITKDCTALWRHISFQSDGVATEVCESVLTDEMIAALLEKVNARDMTLSLDLERCHEINGRCLEPLRHSKALKSVNFARDSHRLEDEVLEDVLRTMIPYNLENVKLPPADEMSAHRSLLLRELREQKLRSMNLSCKYCEPPAQQKCRADALSHSFVATSSSSYHHTGQINNDVERDSESLISTFKHVQDLCPHCRSKEKTTSVRPVYMENQPDLNERMRAILVDWLVELHNSTRAMVVPETLYVAINLTDRYLERKEVTRGNLQLVGMASLWIAFKHVEIYTHPPLPSFLSYMSDHAFSEDQFLVMEQDILKTLEHQIIVPTAHDFLVCFLKAAHADKRTGQLSSYLLDGTLLSLKLNRYLPSLLAAAAVFISRRTAGRNSWSSALLRCTNYCEEEIAPVARAILEEKARISSLVPHRRGYLRAVYNKYSLIRRGAVADIILASDF